MTGEQLRALRESRKLTREELAAELGNCSASGIVKWESGISPVPQWVEDKMLNTTRVSFPLEDLHELLDLAREEKISFEELLSEGCKLVIENRRSKSQAPDAVNQGAVAKSKIAIPAASSSNIEKMPPQHFATAAEETDSDSALPPPSKINYGSGKGKKRA